MKGFLSMIRRGLLTGLAVGLLLASALSMLVMALGMRGAAQARQDYVHSLPENLLLVTSRTANGIMFGEEDVTALKAVPQVETATAHVFCRQFANDSYDLMLVEEAAFDMGVIPLSEGAGFSETGIGEDGLLEVILCGQVLSGTPVGGQMEVGFGVLRQQLHAVGRVSPPGEILSGNPLYPMTEITSEALMPLNVLIAKDTPEVRGMLNDFYRGLNLEYDSLCFVSLKDSLTQDQFFQTVEQMRERWNVSILGEITETLLPPGEPDLIPYYVKAAMFLLFGFTALTGLCLRTLQKSEGELRLRVRYGKGGFAAGLPLFLNLCLPALLAAVLAKLHMAVRYWIDQNSADLPDILCSITGIYPHEKVYDVTCMLCFLSAVLLAVLIPALFVQLAFHRAKRG